MKESNNYHLLIQKLDSFTRKYYLNQLIRGSLYSIAIVLLAYLSFVSAEYFFYFSSSIRKFLLISFSMVSLGSLGMFVAVPLLKYHRLGQIISPAQAAKIIGEHFVEVQDKLLNVLQLKDLGSQNAQQAELIKASIEQKSNELSPVQFSNAIDLSYNKRYLKYALPPLFLLLSLLVMAPSLLREGTKRIILANEQFEREAPFRFVLLNQELVSPQFEDFTLALEIEGEYLPTEVYIVIDGFRYLLQKNRDQQYAYTFKNVKEPQTFLFSALGYESKLYELSIKERALIQNMEVSLTYPPHTNLPKENLANIGDLILPEGTLVLWSLQSKNTDYVQFELLGDTPTEAKRIDKNTFSFAYTFNKTTPYKIFFGNQKIEYPDTSNYKIQIIEDKYPVIMVKEFKDSSQLSTLYFAGEIVDDYGLSSLWFHYTLSDQKGKALKTEKLPINFPKGRTADFTYFIDFQSLGLGAGQDIQYYFEVFDNDGIRGPKSTRSQLWSNKKESIKELKDKRQETKKEIETQMASSSKESEDIQAKIQSIKEKLLQKKEIDWQTRKEMEQLMKMQEELLKRVQDTKEKFKENQENREETGDKEEELKAKEERLEDLFEEIEKNPVNELMDKIQELMQKMDRDETLSTLEEMKKNNEIMQKNMQRLEELYKNLEVEYEMQEMAKDLNELAEEQQQLSEETTKGDKDQEELMQNQEELNSSMEELLQKLEDLKEKNKDLTRPKDTSSGEDSMKDAMDAMEKAKEELSKENKQDAKEKQKKAADKMKEASQAMKSSMKGGKMEAMQEDLEALRQLLENLLNISFTQEDLIKQFGSTPLNTPKYVSLIQDQFRIKNNFQIVEDSLFALSKRVDQLEAIVLEKSAEIRYNLEKSVQFLEDRQVSTANNNQQRAMTYANDLALIFSDAMENLQMDMAEGMPGNQMCNSPKPGQGSDGSMPMDKISEGQEGLTEEMKKMSEQMKKQGKEGGEGLSAQELAEMMQRQAQLRKALESLNQQKREKGQGSKLLQEIIDNMDKTEYDLANKKLNNETLKRQEQIKIKLLEAVNAEREQEFEEKRKAETAKQDFQIKMPKELEDYLKNRKKGINDYRAISPELNSYYRDLVENYIKALKLVE
jgi:hypothetical protein